MKIVLNVFSSLSNTLTENILREIFHMVIQESCEALEFKQRRFRDSDGNRKKNKITVILARNNVNISTVMLN